MGLTENARRKIFPNRFGCADLRFVRDRADVWTSSSGERSIRSKCRDTSGNGHAGGNWYEIGE